MSEIIENKLVDFQMGFRPNRSTIDNIFMVRQIFEKCYVCNIELHNIFVDYSQEFDSVNRNKIIEYLIKYEIPKKLIKLIGLTLSNSNEKVKFVISSQKNLESSLRSSKGIACPQTYSVLLLIM